MKAPRPRQIAMTAAGLAVSVAFLWFAFARLDMDAVGTALQSAELWPWAGLGALSYCAGHLVRGVRCSVLVSPETQLGIGTASNVVVIGYAVNNLLPLRMGELARSAVLTERTGLPIAQSLTITFAERLFDGVVIVLLFLACAWSMSLPSWAVTAVKIGAVTMGLGMIGVSLCIVTPRLITQVATRIAALLPATIGQSLIQLSLHITLGLAALRDPRTAAKVATLSLLVWLLEAGLFAALLPAIGVELSLFVALFVMAATNLGILVPSSPGFIGPFHLFAMQSLMLLVPITQVDAISYAVLVHVVFFVPVTIWGAVALSVYGIRLGHLLAAARRGKATATVDVAGVTMEVLTTQAAKDNGDPPAPAWMVKVVAALVAQDGLVLDDPVRTTVVARSADIVHNQMSALPPQVKLLFMLGMTFFRITTVLFTLGRFETHSSSKQQRIVEWWAYGPFPLGRQLFRAVRSTALLAYYEADEVRAACLQQALSGATR